MTRRLLVSYLTITLFVLLVLEIPLAIFFRDREFDRLLSDAERDAVVIASFYEDALEHGETEDPSPAVDYRERTGVRVVVVDAGGIAIVDTDGAAGRDFSTRPEIQTALAGDRATGQRDSATLSSEIVYVALPVASGGVVHGAVRLTVDTHEVTERVHQFWLGLTAVALFMLALIAAAGWVIARSVTKPLRTLQSAAHRFAEGDLSRTEVDERAPVELVDLQVAMNRMAGRLERLLTQQRSFVADASHQLRTPLTALRLRLENRQDESTDPAEVAELDAAIAETERLAALVTDLLQLASAERTLTATTVDLAEPVRDRVDTWTAVADVAEVTLRLTGAEHPSPVRAVDGSIEQILDNVLDNAIQVAPPGSTITIDVQRGDDVTVLTIADQGPGLTEEERELALVRFWRRSSATPGSGLGLSIVTALAEAGGGSVRLAANEPTGLAVEVRFVTAGVDARRADGRNRS